jgi:hypothetical protein
MRSVILSLQLPLGFKYVLQFHLDVAYVFQTFRQIVQLDLVSDYTIIRLGGAPPICSGTPKRYNAYRNGTYDSTDIVVCYHIAFDIHI